MSLKSILFFSHDSHLFGATRSMLELAVGLKQQGVNVSLVFPETGEATKFCKTQGMDFEVIYHEVMVFRPRKKDRLLRTFFTNKRASSSILGIIKRLSPDVVYVNTGVRFYPLFCAVQLGIPVVLHLREFGKEDYGLEHMRSGYWFHKALRQASAVLFNSDVLLQFFNKQYPFISSKSHIVYNGVTAPVVERNVVASEGDLHIGIVGVLKQHKGQAIAIESIALLRQQGIPAHLHIYGVGPDERDFKTLASDLNIKDHVDFHGFVTNNSVIYNQCEVVVVCAEFEAFGRVTVETLLGHRVVFGRNSGGTAEILKNFPELLFDGSTHALCQKLKQYYLEPSSFDTVSTQAQSFVQQHFSIESSVAKFITVAKSIT